MIKVKQQIKILKINKNIKCVLCKWFDTPFNEIVKKCIIKVNKNGKYFKNLRKLFRYRTKWIIMK